MRVAYSSDFLESLPAELVEQRLIECDSERYQYVPMRALPRFCYAAEEGESEGEAADVVLHNGQLLRAESPAGLDIYSLEQAQQLFGSALRRRLQESAAGEADVMADLARTGASSPTLIYVPPRSEHTALSMSLRQQGSSWSCNRVTIIVGEAASLELMLEQRTDSASTLLLEVWLEAGARLSIKQRDWANHGWAFTALRAVQQQHSNLQWLAVTEGGATVRWDGHVQLRGEAAEAKLMGTWCLEEARQAHAHIVVEHQAPHCTSDQLYKGVGSKGSNASFEGHIVVAKQAQQTQAYQLNQNLLLDNSARAQSKPSLKVHADDVKASHGSTTGRVDPEALFYLSSRGISPSLAKQMLVQAFTHELLSLVPAAWQPAFCCMNDEG